MSGFLVAARGGFFCLLALVTWLTVTPDPADTKAGMDITRWLAELIFRDPAYGDKIAHFAAYACLGASGALARLHPKGRAYFTVVALALYGAALEGVQAIGMARDPEALDAMANALGAAAGFASMSLVARVFLDRATA